MKINIYQVLSLLIVVFLTLNCGRTTQDKHDNEDEHGHEEEAGHHEDEEGENVHFSADQFDALDMKVDTLSRRNMTSAVQVSGQLEVPPQNEATVTAIIGAKISSIKVIEGDEVKKGQVLAYLSHPDFTRVQSDYLEAYNNAQFLEQEYQRQKRLYEAEVGSGKLYQQAQSSHRSALGMVKSLESQLRQLGVNPSRIREGDFYDQMPVTSPIDGSVVKVAVKTGQYVQPQTNILEIVNTDHIHADLMVFEKDVHKVKKGQRVRFRIETLPQDELFAEIYSVGKMFEQSPKAVHVHAEIENKKGNLIPGMYIKGEILLDSIQTLALPESAIVREEDHFLAFIAEKEKEGDHENWMFTPIEVRTGTSGNGWVEIKPIDKIPENTLFAMNNAYYLLAEMKKGEAEHSH